MSPPGRPKGEYRSAQREGALAGATVQPRQVSRVVIVMDSATSLASALETGVGLAGAMGASLEGRFFEDLDLLRLGDLPFAVELCSVTGARQELSSPHIERALRLEAARQRKLVAASATRKRVPWTFAVAYGQRLTAAIAYEAELVVLGPRARARRGIGRAGPAGPVAAMFDASDAAERAMSAAAHLATSFACEMLILVPDGESRSAKARRDAAQAWLAAEGLGGRVVAIVPERAALVAAVRARHSAVLAMPASALTAWPLDMDMLRDELVCPLVFVR